MERTKIRYECEEGEFAFAYAELEFVDGYAFIKDSDYVWIFDKKDDEYGCTILGSQIVKIYKKKGA
jgi:hypothetical protein